jgi:hypothetical protein
MLEKVLALFISPIMRSSSAISVKTRLLGVECTFKRMAPLLRGFGVETFCRNFLSDIEYIL